MIGAVAAGLREDAWLAEVLGRPVYSLAGDPPRKLPAGFVFARVDAADVRGAQLLEAAGFCLVDTNVTLERSPGPGRVAPGGIDVGPAQREQAESLLAVAGSCFRYSRFHLDPAIERAEADRVKREWVRSYIEGRRGQELLAASVAGKPVGFLAVLDAADARVIDLVGVASAAQGRGVGGALVAAFVQRYGDSLLRVGTQVANVPSLRLYAAHGFVPTAAHYVFHRHG